ncbi:hypothetical protein Riv7116_4414 [Rivularia sp. PCC 7116]|uniref:hypothetical protein n=1 Tax=Rivularia sp. PCC 7116 TaxID=373994 RepID=UPI00029F406A|nr:hypothetical protein [Rivularia sp. PCC 7116]AFY56835.1 hypothetical protein Riv7116_4414 [Rivularia sp. PCC 7116]
MVKTEDYCDECKKKINISVQQTVMNQRLRWSISYICPFCSSMIESDDIGFPPDDIRQLILAEEGEYQLFIKQPELNKVKAVKVLRDALEISITEASNILKLFPKPIVNGTKIEIFYLQKLLECEGIEAEVCSLG